MTESNDKQYTLSEEFMKDYEKYTEQVDETGNNLFNGEKLNKLREDFFKKHNDYMKSFPFYISWSKFPDCGYYEIVAEDKKIIDLDLSSNIALNSTAHEYGRVLGEVYWRASASLYLYTTLVDSRDKIKLNHHEIVQLGRYAIRYNPLSYMVNKWFMITLGYQVDGLSNTREKSVLGNLFLHSTLRCQRMDPNDAINYNLHGRFLYNVANLNWIERKMFAGFSGEKVSASYKEAEEAFIKSHSLKSDWMSTGLWMARCLLAQKRPLEEVKKWIDICLSLEIIDPVSVIERQECLDLKAKLKL